MYGRLIDMFLQSPGATQTDAAPLPANVGPLRVKKVNDRTLSYHHRSRGDWFRPEYDFDEIQIAQGADGYLMQAVLKKVNRVVVAGWNFTSNSAEALKYIKRRIRYNEFASRRSFDEQVEQTFADLFRYKNCMWVKARKPGVPNAKARVTFGGQTIEPVAGYFILPFETLQLKTKKNGDLTSVQQSMPDGAKKFFPRADLVHFYGNRNPGFAVGTPDIMPAIDDIAVLRRLEENIEELVESSLFPTYHWRVGSDNFPERWGKDGTKETDAVKRKLEYLSSGSIYVTDHRHEITAIGAEGRALRIESYIEHFKQRVFASLGVSGVDMGAGGSANRSTASTLSKGMLLDVEAMTKVVKRFVELEVITELLIEGGFDPFDEDQMVHMQFGIIDKEERRADENQQIQLWHANLRTVDEVRSALGDRPFGDEDMDRTYQKMFAEPLKLVGGMVPGSAAGQVLARDPVSNVSEADLAKEKAAASEGAKGARRNAGTGRPAASQTEKAANLNANKARPANQHGVRAAGKTNRDFTHNGQTVSVLVDTCIDDRQFAKWSDSVVKTWECLDSSAVELQTLADTMSWRLR